MAKTIIERIEEMGVFPIIVIDRPADARPLGEALLEAGLPSAEVTFRTSAAAEAIHILSSEFPDLLVGAGTVLNEEQAQSAVDAGAQFILAPGFNSAVVDFCSRQDVVAFPGVCTPTEIEAALRKGLTVLKFFPAEAMGGLAYLKAVSGPLAQARFVPTGGVNLENLPEYLRFEKVLACAGTWIVKKAWLNEGDFNRIRQEAEAAVRVVKEVRGGIEHG
jgi:2-dehydro-3-deoxyphosphogluconate aldolase/(4S)-4-hydroxy-2-oxoglutarate aldolase